MALEERCVRDTDANRRLYWIPFLLAKSPVVVVVRHRKESTDSLTANS